MEIELAREPSEPPSRAHEVTHTKSVLVSRCVCAKCGVALAGPPGSTGLCVRDAIRERNREETGDPKMKRVWTISRHERRRLTGKHRSRAGR